MYVWSVRETSLLSTLNVTISVVPFLNAITGETWKNLEWSLLYFHLLALVSTITLTILTSMAICTCCADPTTILKVLKVLCWLTLIL